MFTVEMLPAQQGDALWIEYGDPDRPCRVLVDAGTPPTYPVVKERIEALPPGDRRFELVVVTHVDTDHIGGALKLLSDRSLASCFGDVWFNDHERLPPCPRIDRGPIDGAIATRVLADAGNAVNRQFAGAAVVVPDGGDLPEVTLPGGLVLTVLSPDRPRLEKLACTWASALRKAGLDPAGPSIDELARKARRKGVVITRDAVPDVATLADRPFTADASSANGSSIAFLAEYEGRSCLFTGDGYAAVLTASLARLRRQRSPAELVIDAVKLPHHGSRRNVSADLVRAVAARAYLFSTDGAVFGHPDPEAVARVVRFGGPDPLLVFNHRSDHNRMWDDAGLAERHGYRTRYPAEGVAGLRVDLHDLA